MLCGMVFARFLVLSDIIAYPPIFQIPPSFVSHTVFSVVVGHKRDVLQYSLKKWWVFRS